VTFLRALLVLSALAAAGCGSTKDAADKAPAPGREHYLVYDRLIGEKGIWIADADGSDPRRLVPEGSSPSLSPDGRWVAYQPSCDGSPACGKTNIVATEPGMTARRPSLPGGWPMEWTPDSTRVVIRVAAGNGDELVSADVASGKEATVARGQFWGWSISPDGSKIVFALAHGQTPENEVFPKIDLYVTDVDGRGDPKAITDTGDSAYPVWGPRSIAFAKLVPVDYPNPDTAWARNEIWKIQPDATGRTRVIGRLPERLLRAYPHWHCIGLKPTDWSDDGSALLAEVTCEGIGQTVAVDPQTGALRSLGEGTFTAGLSHDGELALVQWGDERVGDENMRVLIYPYAGGKPTVVAKGAGSPSWNR
jgi:WD40-like Beta Propeller Repeat